MNIAVVMQAVLLTKKANATVIAVGSDLNGYKIQASVFSQPSIYIDGWLYGMRMTSVVCNVPVLSQNDST